jgi:hypothetical protein
LGRDRPSDSGNDNGIVSNLKPPDRKRRLPPIWVIVSLISFLVLIWTAFRLLYAIRSVGLH